MKKENLCNSCNNKNIINWCDESMKEYAMRGLYDCEWYSEKKENNETKVYIDPLVTRDEMASITSEIKSESYTKISRLIEYLMEEYLVEDVRIEKVFEADKEFYRAKLTYREFPF